MSSDPADTPTDPHQVSVVPTPVLGDLPRGTTLLQRYQILDRKGTGGFGTTYRARDTNQGVSVAVKVLHPHLLTNLEVVTRFDTEAKAMSRVRHPAVCHVIDYGHDTRVNAQCLVMDFVDGVTLKQVLESGAMHPTRAAAIALQLSEALAAVHEAGIVHRDLKPANVMVDARGCVRLLDFGVAKIIGDEYVRLTSTGAVVGSLQYMSPERNVSSTLRHGTSGITEY